MCDRFSRCKLVLEAHAFICASVVCIHIKNRPKISSFRCFPFFFFLFRTRVIWHLIDLISFRMLPDTCTKTQPDTVIGVRLKFQFFFFDFKATQTKRSISKMTDDRLELSSFENNVEEKIDIVRIHQNPLNRSIAINYSKWVWKCRRFAML